MKHFMTMLFVCLTLFIFTSICYAKDMYVGNITKLNLRTSRNVNSKVLATLESGEKVSVLETAADWTKVAAEDGTEGWVASRFLTDQKPANVKIDDLNIKLEALQEQLETTTMENQKLKEENINLTTQLNETKVQQANLEKSFNDLKAGSAQYLSIKDKYNKTSREIAQKDARIQALEKKAGNRYISIAIKGALTGAGILLVGYFLGSKNKRKRSSLL